MSKNLGNNISKKITSKYNQKPYDHAKKYAKDVSRITLNIAIQKTSEATGDFIVNDKIASKIAKASGISLQYNLETDQSETENIGFDREISRERYIPPKSTQKIIYDPRLR